jgi:hypothetical protein
MCCPSRSSASTALPAGAILGRSIDSASKLAARHRPATNSPILTNASGSGSLRAFDHSVGVMQMSVYAQAVSSERKRAVTESIARVWYIASDDAEDDRLGAYRQFAKVRPTRLPRGSSISRIPKHSR